MGPRWTEAGVAQGGIPWWRESFPCKRADPAPPRGVSPDRMALRGKPRDAAEGGFLGGTHSVRPHSDAASEPRHIVIIGGKGTPGGLMGT